MITVDLKTLIAHLNGFCRRSLEGAAGACVSRTNYEVTVEHLLLQMLDEPGSDLSQALAPGSRWGRGSRRRR